MKVGVILPNFGPQANRSALLDTALAAERLGFDSVWATDHLALPESDAQRFGHIFESITTLAYLAGSTGRIRLGISALVLPQRHPLEVGKQLTTLDALSGGRVMLAAGVGWSEGEYDHLGQNFGNRGKRMDEAVRVLRTLWRGSGRVVSFNGKYYPFEKLYFSPLAVQSGGPELWIAGDSAHALRRAAFLGDGWHPNASGAEELRRKLSAARALLSGRKFAVSVRLRVAFTHTPENEHSLVGTTAQVLDQLRAYQEAGMTYAVVHFEASTHGERERSMTLFAQKILPQLVDQSISRG